MKDIKLKLSELENQVSSIKDPNLRKIAFEKLLEHLLGITTQKKGAKGATPKRKSLSKKTKSANFFYYESQIREDVKNLSVTVSLQGLPRFKTCKSKIDSYLWILAYAKKHKIDGLNNHEIAFIMSKKLYKPTKYSTVYGIHRKVKEGLVIQDPGTTFWKITPDGEEHLKTLK